MKILFETYSGKKVIKKFKSLNETKAFVQRNKAFIKEAKIIKEENFNLDDDNFDPTDIPFSDSIDNLLKLFDMIINKVKKKMNNIDMDSGYNPRSGTFYFIIGNKRIPINDLKDYFRRHGDSPSYLLLYAYFKNIAEKYIIDEKLKQ